MQIYGPYRVSTAQTAPAAASTRPSTPTSAARSSAAPTDQLDLSPSTEVNRLAASSSSEAVAGGGEIRVDRVADLRRQIASGNYETPEKLDAALDRLLDAWG